MAWGRLGRKALVVLGSLIAAAAYAEERHQLTLPSEPTPLPQSRLSLGINYTGGQVRWRLSRRWAMEGRIQVGSADSDYGKVHADVFGLRGYRFFRRPTWERMVGYVGGEGAYAKANAEGSSYSVHGFAVGAFGGMDYWFARRCFVGADIGPYVISLRESQTGLTSTDLDFVVNTSLNVVLF